MSGQPATSEGNTNDAPVGLIGRLVAIGGERQQAPRAESAVVGLCVALLAVGLAGYLLYGAYYGPQTALLERSVFYSLAAAGGLALAGLTFRYAVVRCAFYALALASLVPGYYLNQHFMAIVMSGGIATPPTRSCSASCC
ncbi:hypothetical protein [Salinisphaera hydrothermalis]|uniref:hypothetical protein n=1 Tax=Salinisphaera hydrothermalis TaxID=563188 RepID=UPI00333F12E5